MKKFLLNDKLFAMLFDCFSLYDLATLARVCREIAHVLASDEIKSCWKIMYTKLLPEEIISDSESDYRKFNPAITAHKKLGPILLKEIKADPQKAALLIRLGAYTSSLAMLNLLQWIENQRIKIEEAEEKKSELVIKLQNLEQIACLLLENSKSLQRIQSPESAFYTYLDRIIFLMKFLTNPALIQALIKRYPQILTFQSKKYTLLSLAIENENKILKDILLMNPDRILLINTLKTVAADWFPELILKTESELLFLFSLLKKASPDQKIEMSDLKLTYLLLLPPQEQQVEMKALLPAEHKILQKLLKEEKGYTFVFSSEKIATLKKASIQENIRRCC
jgi:hypothetical protein